MLDDGDAPFDEEDPGVDPDSRFFDASSRSSSCMAAGFSSGSSSIENRYTFHACKGKGTGIANQAAQTRTLSILNLEYS